MKRHWLAAWLAAPLVVGALPASADQTITILHGREHRPPNGHMISPLGQSRIETLDPWADREEIGRIEADKAAARADYCRANPCAREIPLR